MNCYIHVPFCAAKCGYCAFYSEVCAASPRHDRFLEHLEFHLSRARLPEVTTLYLGGGTPTLLDAARLRQLIEILQTHLRFAADAERSVEANPETLTAEKIELLRNFFTRISLGVQSFDGELRRRIGRKCGDAALLRALKRVREAQFPHWNCDLIYAIPGQTPEEWRRDLIAAAESGADHVSCYSLTPEPEAALGSDFREDDEREAEMFALAETVLRPYGIERYEISNYARPGAECRHNLNVWRGEKLAGFGPSAADFDGRVRHREPASLDAWLNGAAPEADEIPWTRRLNEIFAVNLRTVAGWTDRMWAALPGADRWEERLKIAEKVKKIRPGMLTITPKRIKLSATGLLFWNDVAQEIL
ncbi:MAG: radical SAM family heme chaperone HemW [Lentisphaeria bacterium]|nr:radical SAM family heme chaperone HemW [Lentisphaeria bacterium]